MVALAAAGVAFLVIRRRDDDDGPDDAGSPDSAGPEDQATATGASDERPESARTD
ncbi:hypothetical protein GCM10025870_24590 [Agromyces marinus]|uniref:LPXTG cell wall anchor domain-containing protein n=2 Tax=Agromyces marinus TaxID=1389020 RepID=A0ABM8H3K7_9MICO|nr:hypothetical protein GCM10025870_24590 [Agromyces marinus]